MVFLKQSTSIDVRLGPFVDVGDGFTPETGVTIAASDEAEVLKANGAATVAMTGTLAAVTGADGWYDYTLAAGDVDTVGELVIVMNDDDVYLPVFMRFYVVEEAVYDDLFGASADPFTTLQSDAAAIEAKASDTHSRLVVVEAAIDSDQTSRTTAISDVKSELVIISAAVATLDTAVDSDQTSRTAAISDVHSRLVVLETAVDSDQTSRTTAISDVKSELVIISAAVATLDAAVDSDQTSRTAAISDVKSALTIAASDAAAIELALVTATGALESTPSSTVLQTDLPELTDDHYANMVFVMTSGDEAGEARRIDAYTGSTGTVTLKTALSGAPTAAETFAILNIPVYGDVLASDTLAIEAKASDTHSRLVVVETAIDSDQTSRTAAISDIKSELVIVSAAVATLDAAVDSDQTSRTAAISDVHSRIVVVESSIDSDQTSRTAAISDVKSALTIAASDAAALEVGVNVTQISGDTAAADMLEAMMDGMVLAQVNDASATTTAFAADQFTEATDDHFNGRLITFVTGALTGQQTDITDYDAAGHAQGSQAFVVTALTEAPANDVWFVIH